MSFWNSLRISASGLSAQRLRLDMISNNIANAPDHPHRSRRPVSASGCCFRCPEYHHQPAQLHFRPAGEYALSVDRRGQSGGVAVSQIVTDQDPGTRVYDPTHPDADANGYVTYPNVNLVVEMTNMLSATRSYEASLQVVDASKRMALKALDIGK